MIDRDVLHRILSLGVKAPSGDNTQPWSFVIDGDVIIVRCHPELDHPILNVDARGTYLATGALIENIVIAAREEGLESSVRLFEREGETARIVLSYGQIKGHDLFSAIADRHTHRGPYEVTLPKGHEDALRVGTEEHCKIKIITDAKKIRTIADASVAMEEAALSTQKLHYHFFRSIIWKAHENERGDTGLFIKTTELPPPVQGLFRLIRHWGIMRLFHYLGLPAMAAKSNAEVYASSGAIAAISVDRTEPRDFIAAGRCMQRVWLSATKHNMAAQPLAGLIYLAEYVARTDDPDFDPGLKKKILTARENLRAISNEEQGTIAMLLRIGVPRKAASARSRRRPPAIV